MVKSEEMQLTTPPKATPVKKKVEEQARRKQEQQIARKEGTLLLNNELILRGSVHFLRQSILNETPSTYPYELSRITNKTGTVPNKILKGH